MKSVCFVVSAVAAILMMTSNAYVFTSVKIEGMISIDPENGSCPDGFDLTVNGEECIKPEKIDCDDSHDHPYCTDLMGRDGHIFCDVYQDLTGESYPTGSPRLL